MQYIHYKWPTMTVGCGYLRKYQRILFEKIVLSNNKKQDSGTKLYFANIT